MNVLKNTGPNYVQNMIDNMILTSYSDESYLVASWGGYVASKHSNDVTRQVKTPDKSTILLLDKMP